MRRLLLALVLVAGCHQEAATPVAPDHGVWLRPFRNLIYAMPPYICSALEIDRITSAMVAVAESAG